MKDWYCIIQGQDENGYWKKLISNKILANTKKEAREKIESEYNKKIPMRILNKDIKPDSILLSLYEMKQGEYKAVHNQFIEKECKQCINKFIPIEKQNFNLGGGNEFCSYECSEKYKMENIQYSNWNTSIPVIYKITQLSTNRVYIGKTIRSFTLRWWEHIKSTNNNKFHNELDNSDITDWSFQVIENVENGNNILERESYWINHYNSINKGFNTLIPKSDKETNNET